MAEPLNVLKKDYRSRFCHGGGKEIEVQPGQNLLKIIQDCFESCDNDVRINSPSTTFCSTPVRKKKGTSVKKKKPNARLTNSLKNTSSSSDSLSTSPLKAVTSKGQSLKSHLTPEIHDADQAESPESKGESPNKNVTEDINDLSRSPGKTRSILEDVEAQCRSPVKLSAFRVDQETVGSPLLVKEAVTSPGHILQFDEQGTPAVVKSHVEVECLEGPQTEKNEQLAVVQGTNCVAISSLQRKKSFSSAFLAAVTTAGKRCSISISPPSPPLVKAQDLEIENECEFLIDESDDVSSNSWFSIPKKNKASKRNGSATPALKSQSLERQKTESKKEKNRKVQSEAPDEEQIPDLDVKVQPDFKSASESETSSGKKGKALKPQRRSSTRMEKTKKEALKPDSSKQRRDTSWKPEDKELSGLDKKASDAEQCKKREIPSEDPSILSAGDQQEAQPKKSLKSSNYKQSSLKTSRPLVHKKQNVKQKLSKDKVSKKVAEITRKKVKPSDKKNSNTELLPTVGSSESKLGEEGLERESVDLNEVFSSPLHSKLQTSKIQNLANSEKQKTVLHSLESHGGTSNKHPVKAKELLQNPKETVQNSEKRPSAKTVKKKPDKIYHKARKKVRSNIDATEPENTTDSESSSLQDEVEKTPKPSNKKSSNKRKRNMQHGSQDFSAAENLMNHRSGPLLEHDVKFTSRRRSLACREDNSSSDSSEDLDSQINDLLANEIARHKIVMPSNTPNVRRTKRIRLRPLEYWRGERVNYAVRPSGLVISGIVCPETEPRRKMRRKCGHKPKRDQTSNEVAVSLDQTLADISKPTAVVDPITNKEVLLECISSGKKHSCFFKDQSIEIHKNLNTSNFAMGKLILQPLKEKGHQFVHMDTIAFHILQGEIVLTLHKTSYYLTAGDFFYVPAGNGYNIRNILNKESILLFTQLKNDSPKAEQMLETSSP